MKPDGDGHLLYHLDHLVHMFARWVDPRDNFNLEGSGLRKKAFRFRKTLSSSSQGRLLLLILGLFL